MDKKSFILHLDSLKILEKLTDEQAGIFIKQIYYYQINGKISNPNLDLWLEMALNPFINQFNRDILKYKKACDRNRENGKKGGRPKNQADEKNRKNPVGFSETEKTQSVFQKPKKPDSDSDSDSDSDNGNDSDNVNKRNDWHDFLKKFNSVTGKKKRFVDEKAKRQIKSLIKQGVTINEILTAAKNCSNDKYHIENPKYLTPEFISRPDKFSKYIDASPETQKNEENEIKEEYKNQNWKIH